MITQNSNNRAAGSSSKTCDPIIPIGAIDKTNNVYVAMSLSSTGVVNTSFKQIIHTDVSYVEWANHSL